MPAKLSPGLPSLPAHLACLNTGFSSCPWKKGLHPILNRLCFRDCLVIRRNLRIPPQNNVLFVCVCSFCFFRVVPEAYGSFLVKLELQLLAYTTATAVRNLSHI